MTGDPPDLWLRLGPPHGPPQQLGPPEGPLPAARPLTRDQWHESLRGSSADHPCYSCGVDTVFFCSDCGRRICRFCYGHEGHAGGNCRLSCMDADAQAAEWAREKKEGRA